MTARIILPISIVTPSVRADERRKATYKVLYHGGNGFYRLCRPTRADLKRAKNPAGR